MASDYRGPLNLGTDELVTINELVDMVARVASKPVTKRHNLSGPQGVRGRNSNNTRLREGLGTLHPVGARARRDVRVDRSSGSF